MTLLALLTGTAVAAVAIDGDGASGSDGHLLGDVETEAREEPDVGARFDFNDSTNTVTIEDRKDDTRELIALRNIEEFKLGSASSSFGSEFSLTFFLVDEGREFPPSLEDVVENGKLVEEKGFIRFSSGSILITLDADLAHAGLEEMGTGDLGGFSDPSDQNDLTVDENTDTRNFEIESSRTFDAFPSIDGSHNSDFIYDPPEQFDQANLLPTLMPISAITGIDGEIAAGSDLSDQLQATEQGNTLLGFGSDDVLRLGGVGDTADGGIGVGFIRAEGENSAVLGVAGEDVLFLEIGFSGVASDTSSPHNDC